MTSVQYAIDLLTDVLTVRKRNIKIAETEGYISRVPPGFKEQTEQVELALEVLAKYTENRDKVSMCSCHAGEYQACPEHDLRQYDNV